MSTVLVVTGGYDYEGESVIAVAATLTVAKRVVAKRYDFPVRSITWQHFKASPGDPESWMWRPTSAERLARGANWPPDYVSIERHEVIA